MKRRKNCFWLEFHKGYGSGEKLKKAIQRNKIIYIKIFLPHVGYLSPCYQLRYGLRSKIFLKYREAKKKVKSRK